MGTTALASTPDEATHVIDTLKMDSLYINVGHSSAHIDILAMHLFIQFLAHNNSLNQWMDAFMWLIEVNSSPCSYNVEEEARVSRLLNDPSAAIGHISWSENSEIETLPTDEWSYLEGKWKDIHRKSMSTISKTYSLSHEATD